LSAFLVDVEAGLQTASVDLKVGRYTQKRNCLARSQIGAETKKADLMKVGLENRASQKPALRRISR
jgi:hypothetical protein